jgi:phage gp45-like
MIEHMARRIVAMLGLGRSTTQSVEGSTATVQLSFIGTQNAGPELRDGVPSMQHYGFASATLPGCDYAVMFLAGNRTHGVAVASNDQRYRPATLKPGEAVMYDNAGQEVYLSQSGIVVKSATSITLSAGGHTLVINSTGILLDGGVYGNHEHTSNTPGTPTSAPIAGT